MVEVFSQQNIANNNQEQLIDLDLLNSIRKDASLSASGRPTKLLKALENNRFLKWVDMDQVNNDKRFEIIYIIIIY